jgi:hypothetical protein
MQGSNYSVLLQLALKVEIVIQSISAIIDKLSFISLLLCGRIYFD